MAFQSRDHIGFIGQEQLQLQLAALNLIRVLTFALAQRHERTNNAPSLHAESVGRRTIVKAQHRVKLAGDVVILNTIQPLTTVRVKRVVHDGGHRDKGERNTAEPSTSPATAGSLTAS